MVPSSFNNSRVYYFTPSAIITLEWSRPQGVGSKGVADYYVVTISSTSPSLSNESASVNSTALNVTVLYGVTYMFSVSAINCAGASDAAILSNIRLGMTEIRRFE